MLLNQINISDIMSLEDTFEGKRGRIVGRVGPMFAGKSSEVMRLIERREIALKNRGALEDSSIVAFRPANDTRYSQTKIVTHSGKEMDAVNFTNSGEILDYINSLNGKPDSIYISEVTFTDSKVIDVIKYCTSNGVNVFYEGLNQTSEGIPFPFTDTDEHGFPVDHIGTLMALTDDLRTLDSVCTECGSDSASKTYYKHGKKDALKVGGSEDYEARCVDCWEPNS